MPIKQPEFTNFCEQHPRTPECAATIVSGRAVFLQWYFNAPFKAYFLNVLLIENNQVTGRWTGPADAVLNFEQGRKSFEAKTNDQEEYRAVCVRTVPRQLQQSPTVTLHAKRRYSKTKQDWQPFPECQDLTLTDYEWTEIIKFATCFKQPEPAA